MGKCRDTGKRPSKSSQAKKIRTCGISRTSRSNFKATSRQPHVSRSRRRNLVDSSEDFYSAPQQNSLTSEVKNEEYKTLEANKERSRSYFYSLFLNVINAADVILEVVDARDPLGTKCIEVDETINKICSNKKLVLVLNKADLVPREVLELWLNYFKRKVPVVPFKSSIQQQTLRLGQRKFYTSKNHLKGASSIGAEIIMSLLGNYTRDNGVRKAICVGVVGLPNVGKSSIINSLKRRRACEVGAKPGITLCVQIIKLDSKIRLLDSPGIVFRPETDAHAALHNAVDISLITDPITPANAILEKVSKDKMMDLYGVTNYESFDEFYSLLALKTGKLKKCGIPNLELAARSILVDWNTGKIPYYTVPPEELELDSNNYTIVSQMGTEFDMNSLEQKRTDFLEKLHDENQFSNPEDYVQDGESLIKAMLNIDTKYKLSHILPKSVYRNEFEMTLEGNQQLNKVRKNQFKKAKKRRSRVEKLSNVLESLSI